MATKLSPIDVTELLAVEKEEKRIMKAEVLAAKNEVAVQLARYQFLKNHTGTVALQNNNVFLDNQANWNILKTYIEKNFLSEGKLEDLETAFQACRVAKQLLEWTGAYERKTNSQEGIPSQVIRPTFEEPVVHLELTRSEIVKMSKDKLKLMLAKGGKPVLDEINRILRCE